MPVALTLVGMPVLVAVMATPVHAGNRIDMPFHCKMVNGHPQLTPGIKQRYRIAGKRVRRSFTSCRDRAGKRCTTSLVHRFKVRCGKGRTSWLSIVAAAQALRLSKRRGRLTWVEDGRLHRAYGAKRAVVEYACWRSRAIVRVTTKRSKARGCLPRWRFRTADHVVRFPAGFAPLAAAKARFVSENDEREIPLARSAPQPATPLGPPKPANVAQQSTDQDARGHGLEQDVYPAGHLPEIDPAYIAQPGDVEEQVAGLGGRANRWRKVTVVRPAAGGRDANPYAGTAFMMMMGALGLALAAAGGWFGWRHRLQVVGLARGEGLASRWRAHALSRWRLPFAPLSVLKGWMARAPRANAGVGGRDEGSASNRASAPTDPQEVAPDTGNRPRSFADLRLQLKAARRARTDALRAVKHLKAAPALRDVLLRELATLSERFDAVHARGDAGPETLSADCAALDALEQDYRRLSAIAASAAASIPTEDDVRMPETADDAYAILGVNPHVSDKALKRVVEALRMSWHPDHARGRKDHARRDQRIKQINVAWDLIKAEPGRNL
ncbi:MAG: J domain-containing protein [Pseudomonadota bacterium]